MQKNPYEDIIDLPHRVSKNHVQMPRESRAAQFAPFAALTGYDSCVKEEARLTDERAELTDGQIEKLNIKTAYLISRIKERPRITVTYFLPDEKKNGGSYVAAEGELSQIEEASGVLIFTDKKRIPLFDILDIESEIFEGLRFDLI